MNGKGKLWNRNGYKEEGKRYIQTVYSSSNMKLNKQKNHANNYLCLLAQVNFKNSLECHNTPFFSHLRLPFHNFKICFKLLELVICQVVNICCTNFVGLIYTTQSVMKSDHDIC